MALRQAHARTRTFSNKDAIENSYRWNQRRRPFQKRRRISKFSEMCASLLAQTAQSKVLIVAWNRLIFWLFQRRYSEAAEKYVCWWSPTVKYFIRTRNILIIFYSVTLSLSHINRFQIVSSSFYVWNISRIALSSYHNPDHLSRFVFVYFTFYHFRLDIQTVLMSPGNVSRQQFKSVKISFIHKNIMNFSLFHWN